LILVLLDTPANRVFVLDHVSELAEAFPTPARQALRALRAGTDPGDAVILVRPRVATRRTAERTN